MRKEQHFGVDKTKEKQSYHTVSIGFLPYVFCSPVSFSLCFHAPKQQNLLAI
uniref:Uncharacterized protein n=1 Tax=Rhizophora mucronata TaxID=61149 RepID=A0A2P2QNW5_RHIMU